MASFNSSLSFRIYGKHILTTFLLKPQNFLFFFPQTNLVDPSNKCKRTWEPRELVVNISIIFCIWASLYSNSDKFPPKIKQRLCPTAVLSFPKMCNTSNDNYCQTQVLHFEEEKRHCTFIGITVQLQLLYLLLLLLIG